MVFELKDKVVLITGAASGIGAVVVRLMLEDGVKHVAVLDLAEAAGKAQEEELNSKYGDNKVKFYKVDVTNNDQLLGAFKAVTDHCGYLDVVINNAGILHARLDTYKLQIDINVSALVFSTIKAFELMRKDQGGKGGTVINIASTVALCQTPMSPLYSATKSAVLQFSNCIGMEEYYSRTGIRVMAVCFGATNTSLLNPDNIGNYVKGIEADFSKYVEKFKMQGPESAAKGVIDCFKYGTSGSTWLATGGKPARDVSDVVKKAYDILSELAFEE